jgi:hypothetical protein
MLRNTAIAICLLAGCASLASYWLSQRKVLAGERPSLGGIGLAIGTALLLFGEIIALTTTWVDSIESASTADLPLPVVGQPLASPFPTARPIATDKNAMSREAQYVRASPYVPTTTPETDTEARSAAPRVASSVPGTVYARVVRSSGPVGPTSGYLWGATRCVFAFRQDPTEERWTLENDCGVPVGVMLATCADHQARCAGGWRVVNEGMLLPGKPQRSVSLREQTQRGARIRYIACAIEDPDTIAFMAIDPPAMPTNARREALDAAAQNDLCVGAIRDGSIDRLFGPGAPPSPHEALIRQ